MTFDATSFTPATFEAIMPTFDGCIFDPAIFDASECVIPPVTVTPPRGGLLLNPSHRAMTPVEYRGPASRRISDAAIAAATAKFRKRRNDDEWLLELINDTAWIEV